MMQKLVLAGIATKKFRNICHILQFLTDISQTIDWIMSTLVDEAEWNWAFVLKKISYWNWQHRS